MQPEFNKCEYRNRGNGIDCADRADNGRSTTALLAPSRMNLFGLGDGTILAGLFLIGVPARGRRWTAMLVLLWAVVGCWRTRM